MNDALPPPVDEISSGIDELIEEHLARLTEKVSKGVSVPEVAEEVSKLNDLLISYKLRDELLEQLLDSSTPKLRREQTLETLRVQRMMVAANRAELERLHTRSHTLLARSVQLILKIQRQINKEAHKYSGYELETCGFCNGFGGTTDNPCPACQGKRTVLVRQPPIKCPRCKGDGKPGGEVRYSSKVCVVCNGCGWVLTTPSQ